jgi:hypothetical protein
MSRPIWRPYIEGFAANQQIKGHVHPLFYNRRENRVGIGNYPPAVRETAAGIFVRSARGLDDTIEGDEFNRDDLSHDELSSEIRVATRQN